MKSRLIVADDHEVVRQGLREMFARAPDLEVVAEAADGVQAERLARSVAADLLILDIALPGRSGVQVLDALRTQGIRLPVLFFTMYPAAQYVAYARRAGAQGFVSKSSPSGELMRAVRRILAGGSSFESPLPPAGDAEPADDPFARLSRRETEVMQGLLRGDSLTRIAATAGIGAKSVSTYRRRLLDKLGVQSNAELAALASRHGHL